MYFLMLLIFVVLASSKTALAENVSFESAVSLLATKKFKEKEAAIEKIMLAGNQSGQAEKVLAIFKPLLKGQLYYKKDNKQIVVLSKKNDEYKAADILTHQVLEETSKRKFKKITVNNKLRRQLRALIATLSLSHKDSSVRLKAVQEMMGAVKIDDIENIQSYFKNEKDDDVIEAFNTLVALIDIEQENDEQRLAAISILSESLEPKAYNKIVSLVEKDEENNYIEQNIDIVYAAIKAKRKIDDRQEVYAFFEKIFFGLSLGSVLLLAAIGLAITFGVMGVINMAHGELIMIGAYTTYVVQLLMPNHIEYSLLVAVPAAFIVSALFGIAIERGVIRFLYGRPLETLLATFGISLILQQLVRSIFSPLNRSVETPLWMSGALEINPVFAITYNRLAIVIFSLVVFALLMLILKRTSLGLKVRAVSQNRAMARAMGIRSEWVDAMTFGLGSGIAGIAGVALSQLTNVGPNLGQSYIIDSFLVVVFGGVGNLWGTLVGAMSLGVFNKFLEPVSGAVLAKILILVFIILFIQKKPRGLFPQKGRAVEN